MYVPGNFPIIFLVMLKINSRFDSSKSPLPNLEPLEPVSMYIT